MAKAKPAGSNLDGGEAMRAVSVGEPETGSPVPTCSMAVVVDSYSWPSDSSSWWMASASSEVAVVAPSGEMASPSSPPL